MAETRHEAVARSVVVLSLSCAPSSPTEAPMVAECAPRLSITISSRSVPTSPTAASSINSASQLAGAKCHRAPLLPPRELPSLRDTTSSRETSSPLFISPLLSHIGSTEAGPSLVSCRSRVMVNGRFEPPVPHRSHRGFACFTSECALAWHPTREPHRH